MSDFDVEYKAGPWTRYKRNTGLVAERESPLGGILVLGYGADGPFEVRRSEGFQPLIFAVEGTTKPRAFAELQSAIDAADEAIAEVAKQGNKASAAEREEEELTLEEMTELVRQLRLRLMSESDINSSTVGPFAEQHFMLAQAVLTQAESQMELATMHRSRDTASRGRLGRDQ